MHCDHNNLRVHCSLIRYSSTVSRACRNSGPVSFKRPTSANQSRNRILRLSLTSSSSTTPPVGNRNTSAFLPQVSLLSLGGGTENHRTDSLFWLCSFR